MAPKTEMTYMQKMLDRIALTYLRTLRRYSLFRWQFALEMIDRSKTPYQKRKAKKIAFLCCRIDQRNFERMWKKQWAIQRYNR